MGEQTTASSLELAREKLGDHLARKGLRRTKQRDVILEAFINSDAHVSVEELYGKVRDRDPSVGFATVYRSMNLLVEAGIAKEMHFNEGRVRFEQSVDEEHHDHFICLGCGAIIEFEDERIEALQEEMARVNDFMVAHHKLEIYGYCACCTAKGLSTG